VQDLAAMAEEAFGCDPKIDDSGFGLTIMLCNFGPEKHYTISTAGGTISCETGTDEYREGLKSQAIVLGDGWVAESPNPQLRASLASLLGGHASTMFDLCEQLKWEKTR
jgi:hypothetical protein